MTIFFIGEKDSWLSPSDQSAPKPAITKKHSKQKWAKWLYEIVGEFASGPSGCAKLSETLHAGLGWPGPARSAARTRPGPARTSPAQPSPAWLGPARPGLARFGAAWPGPGPARPGPARPHLARCNPARPSTSQNQHSTAVNQYTSLAVG